MNQNNLDAEEPSSKGLAVSGESTKYRKKTNPTWELELQRQCTRPMLMKILSDETWSRGKGKAEQCSHLHLS